MNYSTYKYWEEKKPVWRFCVDCWGCTHVTLLLLVPHQVFHSRHHLSSLRLSVFALHTCFCSCTGAIIFTSPSRWPHSTSVKSRRTAVCLSQVVPPSLCCCLWLKLNEITGRNQLAASRNLMLIFWIPQTFPERNPDQWTLWVHSGDGQQVYLLYGKASSKLFFFSFSQFTLSHNEFN